MTNYYVHRTGSHTDLITGAVRTRTGWTGPIAGLDDANREAAAWQSCGWAATVHRDNPSVQARIAEWERATVESWKDSCDPSQRRRYWDHVEEQCQAAE